jgi:hypothetical protein
VKSKMPLPNSAEASWSRGRSLGEKQILTAVLWRFSSTVSVRFLIGALCLLFLSPASCQSAATLDSSAPRVFVLDGQHFRSVRERIRTGDKTFDPALSGLDADAREALKLSPLSVTNKQQTPPSGDKRDYMSQAPYFWRNPDTTNGLPYIRRDGERNPEINKIPNHRQLDQMVDAVETLALAFYFRGDEAYAAKANELLRVWFIDPSTRMNPNLQYAQAIPGVTTGRGIGLIETRGLTRLVDAVGLLAGSKAWTQAHQRSLQDWFAKFLQWMQDSENGREESAAENNHGTYYDLQAISYALFVGQTNLAKEIARTACQKRIAKQIEPDGRQPLELARTRAWSYSTGNLQGLLSLARLAEHVGVDLWNYQTDDGRSIRKAIDFLVPFATGEKKWPYQQLGNWSPEPCFAILRRASPKYPDAPYRGLLSQGPPPEPANRSNLLRPQLGGH